MMNELTRQAARMWALAQPAVSAFVASITRDFQDRDDILQETAVAVLESFGRFDPSHSFKAWAMGVARNQARLHFRRKGRDRLVFSPAALDALAVAFADEDSGAERLVHLGECLSELDEKSRELCRLRYGRDMKPAGIAGLLETEPNTISKALQRIRERMRDCVDGKASAFGVPT